MQLFFCPLINNHVGTRCSIISLVRLLIPPTLVLCVSYWHNSLEPVAAITLREKTTVHFRSPADAMSTGLFLWLSFFWHFYYKIYN